MKFHLAAATSAMLLISGAAFAQNTSAPTDTPDNPVQAEMNDMDRAFFESGTDFTPLYSDMDTMTVYEGDEFNTAFTGMTDGDRASIIEACDRALEERGSYGTVTLGLCDQVDAFEQQ
ncbi:hypothetical protein GTW25_00100 [Aliihoeflea aestuarii]|jgi:hypothetical protein|uniref:hypothetical protein n=1 Tax=Aliihoeflea aestuarii TaxID=453840 RepID=UPI002093C673|nr:hypothetical protein [Aliihoeflea aestuarii]MCO6389432.1 hypothetical protein [Aliihoeflea aestuarii]